MLQKQAGIQNDGYELPNQLSNPLWKKCFDQQNQNKEQILKGLKSIRSYLSQNVQIQTLIVNVLETQIHKPIIKYGRKILGKFVMNFALQIDLQCLYEIIWIFTNLCSGSKSNTSKVIDVGIVNFCKECFGLENYGKIISILFELMGNLAGEMNCKIKMSFLADHNFYNFMNIKYKNYLSIKDFHQNASWAFQNLFRDFKILTENGSSETIQNYILPYFPIIKNLLQIEEQQAKISLLYVFFYLSKDQALYMKEVFEIIQKYLFSDKQKIVNLVMQTIGNYIANCDQAVDYALNNYNFLNIVFNKLKTSNKVSIKKQAAWIVSNIFGGRQDQTQKFVMIPTLFNELHSALTNQTNQSVLKELVWSISNCFSTSSQKTFEVVFYSSIVQPLSLKVRQCYQNKIHQVYLEGIKFYLKRFEMNPNLQFNIFLRNKVQLQSTFIYLCELSDQFEQIIEKYRQKIQQLVLRGPITQYQMVAAHIQNFQI